jgi:phage-related protein
MISSTLALEIGLTMLDPYAYDVTATTVGGTGNHSLPLGTGLTRPRITVAGPVTGPITFGYYAHGALQAALVISGNLASGDTLVVDCDAMTVIVNGTNALSRFAQGDFFVIDPVRDDDAVFGWPFMNMNPNDAMTVEYFKAWR